MKIFKQYMPSVQLPALFVVFAIVIGVLFVHKMYFFVIFDEKKTRIDIQKIFEKNILKAIQFDDISITLSGNIILNNVKIAPTTDFNDDYHFLTCTKAIIDLNYFKAVMGVIKVEELEFKNSSITVVKNYGKGYRETFNSIFPAIDDSGGISLDNFTIKAEGSITYHDNFSTDSIRLYIDDAKVYLNFENNTLYYGIKGAAQPLKDELDTGTIDISGEIIYSEEKNYQSSRHEVYVKKIDAHLANPFIKEYTHLPLHLSGYVYTDVIITHGGSYAISGSLDVDNCTIEHTEKTPSYKIISNNNISINSSMEFNSDLSYIDVSSLEFNDKELSVNASFKYNRGRLIQMFLETNDIDLANCDYIQLLPHLYHEGSLQLKATFDYDIASKTMKSMELQCNAQGLSLFRKIDKTVDPLIQNARVKIKGDANVLHVDVFAHHINSDIHFKSSTNIDTWAPFASTTEITMQSKKMSVPLLFKIFKKGAVSLYAGAVEDARVGHKQIAFREMPLGKYLINNTVKTTISVDQLYFNNNAFINNCRLELLLSKGTLSTQSFACEGYSAVYSLGIRGMFNSDYPSLAVDAAIRNYDYGTFMQAMGNPHSAGIMNAAFTYSVSGYRLSHLLQNGIGSLDIRIVNALINTSRLQTYIIDTAKQCGITIPGGTLPWNRFNLAISHGSGRWTVQNASLDAGNIQCGVYGNYTIDKGLSMPSFITVYSKDGSGNTRSQHIAFTITGRLDNPVIVPRHPCRTKEFSLFKVN